jgi:hypothetical protein
MVSYFIYLVDSPLILGQTSISKESSLALYPVVCTSCPRTLCASPSYYQIQTSPDQLGRYFTKDSYCGVCIFRRRETTEQNHRGFRLSSLGILLAKSPRPRPWRHVPGLKKLIDTIYTSFGNRGVLEPTEMDWDPARMFFDGRKVKADTEASSIWSGWSHELDGVSIYFCIFFTLLTVGILSAAQSGSA